MLGLHITYGKRNQNHNPVVYISHADQVFDKVEKNHSISHKNMTNKDSSTNRHIYLQIRVIN